MSDMTALLTATVLFAEDREDVERTATSSKVDVVRTESDQVVNVSRDPIAEDIAGGLDGLHFGGVELPLAWRWMIRRQKGADSQKV